MFFCSSSSPSSPVGPDQVPNLLLGVAGVPAGQMDVVGQRAEALHLVPVHDRAGGAVRSLLVQLSVGPVEDRHKTIGDALHTVFGTAEDVFA